jgi:hypothetical protein
MLGSMVLWVLWLHLYQSGNISLLAAWVVQFIIYLFLLHCHRHYLFINYLFLLHCHRLSQYHVGLFTTQCIFVILWGNLSTDCLGDSCTVVAGGHNTKPASDFPRPPPLPSLLPINVRDMMRDTTHRWVASTWFLALPCLGTRSGKERGDGSKTEEREITHR